MTVNLVLRVVVLVHSNMDYDDIQDALVDMDFQKSGIAAGDFNPDGNITNYGYAGPRTLSDAQIEAKRKEEYRELMAQEADQTKHDELKEAYGD